MHDLFTRGVTPEGELRPTCDSNRTRFGWMSKDWRIGSLLDVAARAPDLLCRSACAVAARHQREHQWPAAPVSAQEYRSVRLYPARVERCRPAIEHAPKEMSRLCHALGSLRPVAPPFTRPFKDPLQHDFYAEMCRIEGWSTRMLQQKIDGML